MEDLRVGDRVLTAGGFSRVYAFADHAPDREAEYLGFRTDTGAELQVSRDHIIFAHADRQPVPAVEVQEGDLLWVVRAAAGGEAPLMPSRVVSRVLMRARGMHAPLTEEGSVIVDGVLASSAASVKTLRWGGHALLTGHQLFMLMHAPLQSLCQFAPSACGPEWHSRELGRHAWTQWVLDRFGWLQEMNRQHSDLRAALLEPSAASLAAASAQVLAAASLVLLNTVLFALSPWKVFAMLVLLGAKAVRDQGSKSKAD